MPWDRQRRDTNSGAPDVEQAVLSHHSYSGQIGRMMEALEVLVEASPATKNDLRVKDFLALAADAEKAKSAAKETRLERLRLELDAL
jgi:hypothetical protein